MEYKVFNYNAALQLVNFFKNKEIEHTSNLKKIRYDLIKSEFLLSRELQDDKQFMNRYQEDQDILEFILNHFGTMDWELDKIIFRANDQQRKQREIEKLIFKRK